MPPVPEPAMATACSTTEAMPWRSMSFIVKTWICDRRTASFSRSSRFRTPMSTVRPGSTLGAKPPIRESSTGSSPRRAASGMPCTLPLGEVPGVFMSPWASIQSSPTGRFAVLFDHAAAAATEPAATL
jgi:hypothetical protein